MYCSTHKTIGGRSTFFLGKKTISKNNRGLKLGMVNNMGQENLSDVSDEEYIVDNKPKYENIVEKLGKLEVRFKPKQRRNISFKP